MFIVPKRTRFKISDYYNKRATNIYLANCDESFHKDSLLFRSPGIDTVITVVVPPLKSDNTWTFGWIKGVSQLETTKKYGEFAQTNLYFPELNSKKVSMINDGTGFSYPWYKSETNTTVNGPTDLHQKIHLRFKSEFEFGCYAADPLNDDLEISEFKMDAEAFYWLTALNERTGEMIIIDAFKIQYNFSAKIDETKPQGKQVDIVKDSFIKTKVCKQEIPMPVLALPSPRLCIQGDREYSDGTNITIIPRLKSYEPNTETIKVYSEANSNCGEFINQKTVDKLTGETKQEQIKINDWKKGPPSRRSSVENKRVENQKWL